MDIPVEKIDIKELEWHFEIPFWNTKNGYYNLKPNDVINLSENYQIEYDRTMKSDLSYPIDIMKNKGRWLILDGLHSLVKAKILGKAEVEVRKVPKVKLQRLRNKMGKLSFELLRRIKISSFHSFYSLWSKGLSIIFHWELILCLIICSLSGYANCELS